MDTDEENIRTDSVYLSFYLSLYPFIRRIMSKHENILNKQKYVSGKLLDNENCIKLEKSFKETKDCFFLLLAQDLKVFESSAS